VAPFSLRLARADELPKLVAIDDEASELYAQAGLEIVLTKDHPFVVAESVRWARAIAQSLAHVAVDGQDEPIGFMTLGFVDGEPYLDQLAVRPSAMRRGIGSALLRQAFSWCAPRSLWLTTYSHLPWNRRYYERHGFVRVPEAECGPELRAILEEQRAALPDPGERIAMVRQAQRQ
jgi:GNAT superfamily N-acetyltransferase